LATASSEAESGVSRILFISLRSAFLTARSAAGRSGPQHELTAQTAQHPLRRQARSERALVLPAPPGGRPRSP
jgi:hypothetical protein